MNADLVARTMSGIGLGIAGVVAFMQYLTFRRERSHTPKLQITFKPASDAVLLATETLIVLRCSVNNQAYDPNTLVGIGCCVRRLPRPFPLYRASWLRVGSLALDKALRLAIQPDRDLSPEDWSRLLTEQGRLPEEGLWSLPRYLRGVESQRLIIGIASEERDMTRVGRLTILLSDIMGRTHACEITPMPHCRRP